MKKTKQKSLRWTFLLNLIATMLLTIALLGIVIITYSTTQRAMIDVAVSASEISAGNINPATQVEVNGVVYEKDQSNAKVAGYLSTLQGAVTLESSVTIGGVDYNVTSIVGSAFYECNAITSVIIPSGVTILGNSVFSCCENLEQVIIPNSVVTIDAAAFNCCRSLATIVLPEGVTTIGDYVFEDSGLETIWLPSTLTSVGDNAFAGSICEVWTSASAHPTGIYIGPEEEGIWYRDCDFDSGNNPVSSIVGIDTDNDGYRNKIHYFRSDVSVVTVTINSGVALEESDEWYLSNGGKTATKYVLSGSAVGVLPRSASGADLDWGASGVLIDESYVANQNLTLEKYEAPETGVALDVSAGIAMVVLLGALLVVVSRKKKEQI